MQLSETELDTIKYGLEDRLSYLDAIADEAHIGITGKSMLRMETQEVLERIRRELIKRRDKE